MSVFSIALIFVIAWWLGWFLTLPFGNRAPDKSEPGHASSAPVRPRLLIKAAIATAIACVLTAIITLVILSDWIDLRE
ncbi:MAG: DUF1467 family protein [Alphaproteobacteria bacterium]|jgi:predicted secreted protein|nr:DUF1467 family protein [Alphaproteobacteria bacterium]